MKSYGYVLILSLFFLQNSVFGLEPDPSEAPPLSARRGDSSEALFKKMLLKIPFGGRIEEEVFEGLALRSGHLLKAEWIRKVVGTENFYLVSSGIQIFSSDPQGQDERSLVGAEASPEVEKKRGTFEALKSYLKRKKINIEDEQRATKALFPERSSYSLFASYYNGPDFIYGEEDSPKIQEAVAFLLKTHMLPTQKNIQAVRALGLTLSSYMGPIPEERKVQSFKKKILQWYEKDPSFGLMNSELMEIPQELFFLLIIDPKLSVYCPDLKKIKYAPGYFYLSKPCEMRLVSLRGEEPCVGLEASLRRTIFREAKDVLSLPKIGEPISNLAYLALLNFTENQKQRAINNLVFLGQAPDFGDTGNVSVVEELHSLFIPVYYTKKLQREHFSTDFWVTEPILNLWKTESQKDQQAIVNLWRLGRSTPLTLEIGRRLYRGERYEGILSEFMSAFSSLSSDETKDKFLYFVKIIEQFLIKLELQDEREEDSTEIREKYNFFNCSFWAGIQKIRDNNGALEKTPFAHITQKLVFSWVESSSDAEKEAIVHIAGYFNLNDGTYVNDDNLLTYDFSLEKDDPFGKPELYSKKDDPYFTDNFYLKEYSWRMQRIVMMMRTGFKGVFSPFPFSKITRKAILACSRLSDYYEKDKILSLLCLVGHGMPLNRVDVRIVQELAHVLLSLDKMKPEAERRCKPGSYQEYYGYVTADMIEKILKDMENVPKNPSQLELKRYGRKPYLWYLSKILRENEEYLSFLK